MDKGRKPACKREKALSQQNKYINQQKEGKTK